MSITIFTIGGLVSLSRLLTWLMHIHICQHIVRATLDREDGLTATDIGVNTRQFRKWRKLRALAKRDTNIALRDDARKALALQALVYALFVPGMLLIVIGVSMQG